MSAADAELKLRGAFLSVSRVVGGAVTFDEASRWACQLLHSPVDNVRGALCHLPGWHTNFPEDSEDRRHDSALSLLVIIAQFILRERRPWYRHPKWHVWHWRLQVHPVQNVKRWMFSRCAGCGGRFPYGYTPTSNQWDGDGPQWFTSERDVYHSECSTHGGPSSAYVRSDR